MTVPTKNGDSLVSLLIAAHREGEPGRGQEGAGGGDFLTLFPKTHPPLCRAKLLEIIDSVLTSTADINEEEELITLERGINQVEVEDGKSSDKNAHAKN
ncbi:expressed unknown protein [Seminavis robusta]|uniref:Uncharacterized protein n=1 Tax=Seminavis robusta TaxID=568900 RepID=A0A9N8H8C8_9STRA|nr:expressed unknown protein [Seminavis robusta]|eukprot:Sro156_g070780.1 n/a (99) ;mRNA; r:42158-42454